MALEFSPIQIFISYSHDDEDVLLKDDLTEHLLFLKNQGVATIWGYSEIHPGEDSERVSNKHLKEADVILLLVSRDYLASDFCRTQMKDALQRHKIDHICVIPILLRPVYWQEEPFKDLEVLPKNAKPISLWPNTDEAFVNIVLYIKEAVYSLLKYRYMKTGKSLYEDNDLGDALTAFEQAIQVDTQLEEAYLWMGKVLSQLGQHAKALAAFDQAILLNPQNASYYAEKAALLFKLKQYTYALECFNQAIQLSSENADYYIKESDIYWQLSQHEEALAALDKAIQLNLRNADIYFFKATYNFHLKRYEDASSDCRAAIAIEPNKASYYALLADLYEKLDQGEKALEAIKKAIRLDPQNSEYYFSASKFHWYHDQYDYALLALDVAITLSPQIAKYYVQKADHLLYISQKKELYKRLFFYNASYKPFYEMLYKQLVLSPDTPLFRDDIALIRYRTFGVTSSSIIESALEVIEQALKLEPENFEYHMKKGSALFLLNRYNEAIAAYEQLLGLSPAPQQRRRVYQQKVAIYKTLIEKIRDEAQSYGIQL